MPMLFEQIHPEQPLGDYINSIVYYKDYTADHLMDKFLPDGTTNLVIELADQPQYIFDNHSLEKVQKCTDAWFSGMHTEYLTISAGKQSEMMVISFKALGAHLFIAKNMDDYINKVVPALDVFGNGIIEIRKKIQKAESPKEKFDLIQTYLLSVFQPADFSTEVIHQTLNKLNEEKQALNLKDLAEKSGYSQKQFIHLFKKYVGITPKNYHKISRFNEILAQIHQKEKVSWAEVAVLCGYFDQAHFIKDFQKFSGLNPKKYISDQGEYPHYVPVK